MGPARPQHTTAADTHRRLLGVVERLAAEFEGEVGIRGVIVEVQRARDAVRLMRLDEAANVELIESVARNALAEQSSDLPPAPPQRSPDDGAPS